MTGQKHYPMPALTEQEREDLIKYITGCLEDRCMIMHIRDTLRFDKLRSQIALAALTADSQQLARKVWEALDRVASPEPFMRIAYEAVVNNFNAPPVPALKPVVIPNLPDDCDRTEAHFKYQQAIRAAGYEVKDAE